MVPVCLGNHSGNNFIINNCMYVISVGNDPVKR